MKLLDRDGAEDKLAQEIVGTLSMFEILEIAREYCQVVMFGGKTDDELLELAEEYDVHLCVEGECDETEEELLTVAIKTADPSLN